MKASSDTASAPYDRGDFATRFRALDALRGIAALTIAMGHFGSLDPISGAYYLAVDFFLVLSGFVLAHAYFYEARIGAGQFVWRRFARMYPLHLLTLLLSLLLVRLAGEPIQATPLLLHVFFLHNLGMGPDSLMFNVPSWTISVEFWINATLGTLLLSLGGSRRIRSVIGLVVIAAACFSLLFLLTGHLNATVRDYGLVFNSGLIRCLGSFCLGVAVYTVRRKLPIRLPSVLQAVLFVLFCASMYSPYWHTWTDFLALPLYVVIICSLATDNRTFGRALAKLAPLGDISFAVYLIHWPILLVLRLVAPSVEPDLYGTLLFLTIVVALSVPTHRFVEMPAYRKLLAVGVKHAVPAERTPRPA